jgi:hypothetical protein
VKSVVYFPVSDLGSDGASPYQRIVTSVTVGALKGLPPPKDHES